MKISFDSSCDECTSILKLKGVQRRARAQHRHTQVWERIKLPLLLVSMSQYGCQLVFMAHWLDCCMSRLLHLDFLV